MDEIATRLVAVAVLSVLLAGCTPADAPAETPPRALGEAAAIDYFESHGRHRPIALVFPPPYGDRDWVFYGVDVVESPGGAHYVTDRYHSLAEPSERQTPPVPYGVHEGMHPVDVTQPSPAGFDVFAFQEGTYRSDILLADSVGAHVSEVFANIEPRRGAYRDARPVVAVRARFVNDGDRPGRFACHLSWGQQEARMMWSFPLRVKPTDSVEVRGTAIFAGRIEHAKRIDFDCKNACAVGASTSCRVDRQHNTR